MKSSTSVVELVMLLCSQVGNLIRLIALNHTRGLFFVSDNRMCAHIYEYVYIYFKLSISYPIDEENNL